MAGTLRRSADWAPVFLRLALVIVFITAGSGKLFGWFGGHGLSGTSGFLGMAGFKPAMFWTVLLAITEFGGGLAMLFGILTRWAGLGLAIVMAVALVRVHIKWGLAVNGGDGNFELPLVLLLVALAMTVTGAGKWSLEAKMRKAPAMT